MEFERSPYYEGYAKGYVEGSIVTLARTAKALSVKLNVDIEEIIEAVDADQHAKAQALILAKNI